MIKLSIFLTLLLTPMLALSKPSPLEVQQHLEEVEQQLKTIEQDSHDKRRKLSQEEKLLSDLDLQLQQHLKKQDQLEGELSTLQAQINHLNHAIKQLQKDKLKNIEALKHYLRSKQKQPNSQSVKLVLQQHSIQTLQSTSVLYQYFMDAQAKHITAIKHDLKSITNNRLALKRAQDQSLEVKSQLAAVYQHLKQKKSQRQQAIAAYQTHLQNNLVQQDELHKQHQELNELLEQVQAALKPQFVVTEKEFAKMVGKLPLPIQSSGVQLTSVREAKSNKTYIRAKEGTQVHAVFPGRVVFSDWLRGVGLLIIIDHGQGYMSLYGNNQVLYKSTGDSVQAGEQISRVGQSGGLMEPGLYFELRKDGKALDPHRWIRQG